MMHKVIAGKAREHVLNCLTDRFVVDLLECFVKIAVVEILFKQLQLCLILPQLITLLRKNFPQPRGIFRFQ